MKLNIQLFAQPKLVIYTDLDEKGFKDGLNKMESIAQKGFSAVSVIAKASAIAIAGIASAMSTVVANGISFNKQIEQLQTSFEVMTGSVDKATELVQKLKDVGAKTPYELKGLAQTTQLLMQYGFSADEAYNATINLGDIAQGSAEKMQSIALAFGQMSSLGKVTMQDIKQMINAGFNPLQAIAEMTGETMQEVNARYEEGLISVEEITEAMRYTSSENGKFYKSMEKQSKTLAGQVSTLKDNFNSLSGVLAEGISNTIATKVLPSINDLMQSMEEAFKEGGITNLVKTAINGLGSMLSNTPEFIRMGMNALLEIGRGMASALPDLIPTIVSVLLEIIDIILDNLDDIVSVGVDILVALIDGLLSAIPILIDKVPDLITSLVTALTSPEMIMKLVFAGIEILLAVIKGIFETLPRLYKLPSEIGQSLYNGFAEQWNKLYNVGGQLISGMWQGIKDKWNALKGRVEELGNGIVNKFKAVFGIRSPSRRFRDEIGKQLSAGLGVGFEDELHNVYRDMQKAINLEQGKLMANVESGRVFNTIQNSVPIVIDINGNVDLDGQKVGRLITPTISRTIQSGGA